MKINLEGLLKNKYAIIVLVVGLAILVWPTVSTSESKEPQSPVTEISVPDFSLETEEKRLQEQLSKIKGAGKTSVLLSIEGTASRELAASGEETLVLSAGGTQQVVELYYVNPIYMGAVVVCEGARSPQVRLEIIEAVAAFTGLGSDKIKVLEMAV